MPLYKTITVDPSTKVLIWRIDESYEFLAKNIELTPHCQQRVDGMKSDLHKRGFMSIRHLLRQVHYTDFDLYYNSFGKPHLKDQKHISITHSFEFSGITISEQPVGIDIEKQREKIITIASKFIGFEKDFVNAQQEKIRILTIIWGAKEALYKLYATPGLSFEQHIHIQPFTLQDAYIIGQINYQNKKESFRLSFFEFDGFTAVYVVP